MSLFHYYAIYFLEAEIAIREQYYKTKDEGLAEDRVLSASKIQIWVRVCLFILNIGFFFIGLIATVIGVFAFIQKLNKTGECCSI